VISQRHPGSETRRGRFPGSSLIPDLHAAGGSDPGAAGPDGDSS
jgi:hypothetical protein